MKQEKSNPAGQVCIQRAKYDKRVMFDVQEFQYGVMDASHQGEA